jgi:hypothetical protein
MAGLRVDLLGRPILHDLPGLHDRDSVAHRANDREIVRDEEIREPELGLKSFSRFRICAWIETSSAETGSSQTISFGPSASARAIPSICAPFERFR